MSESETKCFPAWAEQERSGDLAWIAENLFLFWPMAQQGYREFGRGAIVVDTTSGPAGQGHPFGYFTQEMLERLGDEGTQRLIREYDPSFEFVATLLKTQNRVSSYRLGVNPSQPSIESG